METKTAIWATGMSSEELATFNTHVLSSNRHAVKLTTQQYYIEIASGNIADLVLAGSWQEEQDALVLAQVAESCGIPVYSYQEGFGITPLTHGDIIAPLIPGQGVIAPDSDINERPHEEAARIVLGPRGAFYDTPLRNFDRTGLIWSGILSDKLVPGTILTAEDVALCMVGVKIAREAFRHKRDNIVDAHGYLLTLEMVREDREESAKRLKDK